jgi:acetyl-CoA C-acetyltransferase
MKDVVVVDAVRTPTGRFGGCFKNYSAVDLAATLIEQSLVRSDLTGRDIDEVIMGMVYQGGARANPARQAVLSAQLPYEVTAMSINKLCGSGLQSVGLAWQALQTGSADVVLAGGMENMSQVPYVLPGARWGQRLGHGAVEDMMLLDGLWDCFYDCHMGMTAENLAEQYSIDRAMQDDFAVESQRRWGQAQSEGRFDDEIIPVSVEERGRTVVCSVDEHPRPDVTVEQLNELKPAFKKEGTVTAGNASGINDGAALLLLMRAETARSSGLKPLAYVRGVASAGVDPRIMGIGPAPAIRALLKRADLSLDRIGRVELNEAFAAQSIAVGRELDFDWERVNVNGGAIAMGHAVGASGARVATTLLHEMARSKERFGVASLCIGGGMGIAALFEQYE